ncbi:MAG: response regulator [Melioribacteraceae bacterium]|nr:response regulator [Melioribacteraceae bacterium]
MVALIVVLTLIVFIIVDLALRILLQKVRESRIRKEREEALDIGLNLDFTDEAKSLKRVEIDNPKAKILAVDDEEIILDSFRKILVLAGYSIDTVESGKEAIGLIRNNDYDFVFTDLKMPEMDGVEVTKAVKHLRPDIDVIVITGYATIETAVETMKFGASDYVQKPFTEDELIAFVNKSFIKREDKVKKSMKPTIRLVTPSSEESPAKHEFNVPAGYFIAPEHTWTNIEMNGTVRIGIDDFIRKIIGEIDEVKLPKIDQRISKNEILFSLRHKDFTFNLKSPISGTVTSINSEHIEHPEWISAKPYELSWMCSLEPSNLSEELQSLKIGQDTVGWYQDEIGKYETLIDKHKKSSNNGNEEEMSSEAWKEFSQLFLHTQ